MNIYSMSIDDAWSSYLASWYESQYTEERELTESDYYQMWLKDNHNRKQLDFWQIVKDENYLIDPNDLPFWPLTIES